MVIRITKEIRHFSKTKTYNEHFLVIMTILSAFIQVYDNSSLYESVQFIVLADLPEL